MHVLGGWITAALPVWLDAVQVVVLAGVMLAGFLVSRRARLVRCIHGGAERGPGELVFCVAVAVVAAATGLGIAFVAAVLTLSLADPAAALVGRRNGRSALPGRLSAKSWEGTFACLAVAAGVNTAVLLARDDQASPRDWFAVAVVSLLAAGAETVPRPGWDNLAVPVVVAAGWVTLLGA